MIKSTKLGVSFLRVIGNAIIIINAFSHKVYGLTDVIFADKESGKSFYLDVMPAILISVRTALNTKTHLSCKNSIPPTKILQKQIQS